MAEPVVTLAQWQELRREVEGLRAALRALREVQHETDKRLAKVERKATQGKEKGQ